jgi:hypothetical protein
MHIEHIRDQHPMCLDGPKRVHRRIFSCPAPLGMLRVVPPKILRGRPREPIVTPWREQEVEMWLLPVPIHRAWIMEGIGDRQRVPGNDLDEIPRQVHIRTMGQFLRQGNFPLFKRNAIGSLICFRRLKKDMRLALSPGRQILARGKQAVFPSLADVAHLLRGCTDLAHRLPHNITDTGCSLLSAGLIDRTPKS